MMRENIYQILDNCIVFQYYNLFFSSLHKNGTVSLDRINAVDFHTWPHSLVIDNREIIFLNHSDTQSLPIFAIRNKIPQTGHIDTWALLTRNYLDTELDEETISEQDKQLASVGIGPNEFDKISNSLRPTLSGTLEWTYLGLWDVLAMKQQRSLLYHFFGKKYYWKAMAIALRKVSRK